MSRRPIRSTGGPPTAAAIVAAALLAGPAAAEIAAVGPPGAVVEVDAPRTTFAPPDPAWSHGGDGASDFPGWARATGYRAKKGARVGRRTVRGHRGAFEASEVRVFAERACVDPQSIPVWKRVADIVADVAVVMDRTVTMGEGTYSDYDVYAKGQGRHVDRIPAVDPDPQVGPVPIVGVELPGEFIERECGALDSHLIHFDPEDDGASVEGWVDFEGPIVAVLLYGNRLDGSDAIFGAPKVAYQGDFVDDRGRAGRDGMLDPVPWRGLELGVVEGGGVEQVTLGPDAAGRPNHRLSFSLYGDPAGDQIRVLTRAACDCSP